MGSTYRFLVIYSFYKGKNLVIPLFFSKEKSVYWFLEE